MYVADFVRALLLFFFYCFCHCGRLIQRGGGISTLLATQTASVVRVYEGLQRPRLAAFGLVARQKCTPASDNFLFKYCFAFFSFQVSMGFVSGRTPIFSTGFQIALQRVVFKLSSELESQRIGNQAHRFCRQRSCEKATELCGNGRRLVVRCT